VVDSELGIQKTALLLRLCLYLLKKMETLVESKAELINILINQTEVKVKFMAECYICITLKTFQELHE
jgi:hypothetical protein